jgi:hypothetical protein
MMFLPSNLPTIVDVLKCFPLANQGTFFMHKDYAAPTLESPVLLIIGTRPEGIKMAPVILH